MEQEERESKREFVSHVCNAANEVYAAIGLIEKDATKVATYKRLAKCYLELYELAMEGR